MKQTSVVSLFVILVAGRGLSFGNPISQNQMHFSPVNGSQSIPNRTSGGTLLGTTTPPSLQRQNRPPLRSLKGAVDFLPRFAAQNDLSPAVGKTGFLSATQIPAGGGLDSSWTFPVIEGDFNGDGKPDVVTIVRDLTTASRNFSVSVMLSNGDGTFKPPVLTPVLGQYCFQFVVGDLNGDHKDDIVIVHQADNLHPVATMDVLISNGDGTFTAGNSYSITSNALVGGTLADVTGDGKLDLVVADQATPPNVWTMLGNGDGTFQAPTSVALGGPPAMYITFADLNSDGMQDIAEINTNGQFTVYLATSPTSFAPPSYYETSDGRFNAGGITVGDLNGDGKPEVVVPNDTDDNITVYMNNGDGTFQTGVYVDVALAATPGGTVADVCPSGVTIADVNGDDKADIITSNQAGDITVLLGNGDGTFRSPSTGYAVGGFPSTPAVVADFDGDGIPDVIVGDNEFSLVYLRGHGDGTFQAAHDYYSPIPDRGLAYSLSIASGDFNGDGQPDFVISNFVDPTIGFTVFLTRPDGSLSPGVNYGTGGGYNSVAVADFNQDGKLDIAVTDLTAGLVRIFTGNGDGTFTAGGQFMTDSSNTGPAAIVTGDFNHDGYPDLAVVNYWSNNVGVLLNDRKGGFVLSANYSLSPAAPHPQYPGKIVAASLKGNGNTDLLIPLLRPAIAVLSGNGDGTFQPETDIAVDDIPSDVAVADLNQDGKPDLAVTIGTCEDKRYRCGSRERGWHFSDAATLPYLTPERAMGRSFY